MIFKLNRYRTRGSGASLSVSDAEEMLLKSSQESRISNVKTIKDMSVLLKIYAVRQKKLDKYDAVCYIGGVFETITNGN